MNSYAVWVSSTAIRVYCKHGIINSGGIASPSHDFAAILFILLYWVMSHSCDLHPGCLQSQQCAEFPAGFRHADGGEADVRRLVLVGIESVHETVQGIGLPHSGSGREQADSLTVFKYPNLDSISL